DGKPTPTLTTLLRPRDCCGDESDVRLMGHAVRTERRSSLTRAIMLPKTRLLLGSSVSRLDGVRFSHVLSLLRPAVPSIPLAMVDISSRIYPDHPWFCRCR